ncbi:BTAD domain-containing putative transcriptional regulator, partial [Streptomyces sp. NPDC059506]|uniref:AfsR/SARP family transcriptional regulator n=1 Tax=Streptomyces sp. NPDC059506 TaxID=3347751 RepID=UPI0036C80833
MRFGILGPVEIRRDGERLDLRAGRERSLLALFVLNPRRLLPHDRIVDLLWQDPPDSARAQVYNLVSRLRRRLREERPDGLLVTADGGYLFDPGEHATDLGDFREATARGRGAAERAEFGRAAELFSAAVGHWRGAALSGCPEPFAAAARQALEEERLRTVEALLDARLALGRYEQVLEEVGPWLERQPHREDLYRRQMTALAALDRRAEALAGYRQAYRRLKEDLGVGPGAHLRELHRRILEGAPVPVPGSMRGALQGPVPGGPGGDTVVRAAPHPAPPAPAAAGAGAAGAAPVGPAAPPPRCPPPRARGGGGPPRGGPAGPPPGGPGS